MADHEALAEETSINIFWIHLSNWPFKMCWYFDQTTRCWLIMINDFLLRIGSHFYFTLKVSGAPLPWRQRVPWGCSPRSLPPSWNLSGTTTHAPGCRGLPLLHPTRSIVVSVWRVSVASWLAPGARGSGNETTSYSENIGAIGITKVLTTVSSFFDGWGEARSATSLDMPTNKVYT